MTEPAVTLVPFYKGWNVYQQHLVRAVAPLTPEQLALGAAPALRSIGLIATHIVGVRAGWFYYTLDVRDDRLPEFAEWSDRDHQLRPAADLVRGLEMTWQVIDDVLNRWTIPDLDDVVWDMNDEGERVQPYSRQWVIWHLIEHDMHHGGELSFTLGMHGLPAIDL